MLYTPNASDTLATERVAQASSNIVPDLWAQMADKCLVYGARAWCALHDMACVKRAGMAASETKEEGMQQVFQTRAHAAKLLDNGLRPRSKKQHLGPRL